MTAMTITRLGVSELAELAWFLNEARLPSADLAEPGRLFFRINAEGLVGFGGLEGEGADRLLRSVLVLPGYRGVGIGRGLVAVLEQAARQLGVQRLHLLTTTASRFFRTMGYEEADRRAAPSGIAASREFTSLCPASATYLVKAL